MVRRECRRCGRMSADPPLSTWTPYRRLSHGAPPGPVIVKARIVTPCAPLTRTIDFVGPSITIGALITAAHIDTERRTMLFLPAGMVTSSTYVPGQTLIRSPAAEAFTAD